jgi:hypothetical protein
MVVIQGLSGDKENLLEKLIMKILCLTLVHLEVEFFHCSNPQRKIV